MQQQNNYTKWAEAAILFFMWMLVLLSPILFFTEEQYVEWNKVFEAWRALLPFFLLFLINHFLLIPFLLFKDRKGSYILAALISIGAMAALSYGAPPPLRDTPPFRERSENIEGRNPAPPRGLPPKHEAPFGRIPPVLGSFLISFMIIGFDTGLRVFVKYLHLGKKNADLEKEKTATELAFLRTQISPHFFMNTLNNIHALIDLNSEKAKESVIQLSKFMRLLLYDSVEKISLHEEFEFVKNYVELMSLRFTDKVAIELRLPDKTPSKKIPPMLFISFIENSFKHGVSYNAPSTVKIIFTVDNEYLTAYIENSTFDKKEQIEHSGIGLENTLKRLKLLYGDNFKFEIKEEDSLFKIRLAIPI